MEWSGKNMNFGVRQARLSAGPPPPAVLAICLGQLVPFSESQVLFCTWASSTVCLVPFLLMRDAQ